MTAAAAHGRSGIQNAKHKMEIQILDIKKTPSEHLGDIYASAFNKHKTRTQRRREHGA